MRARRLPRHVPARIGTSGWSYDDWEGHVYPRSLDAGARLPFYAERFATVEIDSTYYRDPAPAVVKGWIAKTHGKKGFEFSVKTSGTLTHDLIVDGTVEQVKRVAEAWRILVADPLAAADRLGAILLQLSPAVLHTRAHMERLGVALDALAPHKTAVEFRNKTWHADDRSALKDDALALLDARNSAAVIVDGPPFPPMVAGEADHAFVRFHGRNTESWHKKEEYYGQRYDYDYSAEELDPWAKRLAELARAKRNVRVYFNNHVQGKGYRNAGTMEDMMEREGAAVLRAQSLQKRLF